MTRIEIRAQDGKESVIIDGYVNVTGRDSRPIPDKNGGYFIERIQRGAFEKAVARAEKVSALLDHKWEHVIGDTNSNLTLKEDVIGLRAHAEITDPDVVQLAKEKRLRGWSFDMRNVVEKRSEQENGIPLRTVTGFDISEVSLISDKMRPWYESTTVETRADGDDLVTIERRAEEFEPEFIGLENKNDNMQHDNSKLKEIIQKLGGTV